MKKSALLAAALIAVMAFGACGSNTDTPATSTPPTATPTATPDAPTVPDAIVDDVVDVGDVSERNAEGLRINATTGGDSILIAMDDWKQTLFVPAIDEFNATYPDINLELRQINIQDDNVMTALMATRSIPDVIYDFMRVIPDWAALNWIYPLNELIEGDPDAVYIPEQDMMWRTLNDRLYALPVRSHINNLIIINKDLMNQLNLDMPAPDWTFEDYKEFLIAGTTDEYSGTENLLGANLLGPAMTGIGGNYGYDRATNSYDLSGWVSGINYIMELNAIPGLNAATLRDPADYWGNADCDYTKKFGDGDIGDGWMAWRMGKTLTLTTEVASVPSLNGQMPFEWEIQAFPQTPGIGTRPAAQHTNTFMASTTKYPEAAFEAAKWFSFGERGMIAQLDCYDMKDDLDGSQFIVPITTNPAILAKFETLNLVSPGMLQMASHMYQAVKDDLFQMVPGYGDTVDNYLYPIHEAATNGGDPISIAAEAEVKANENNQLKYDEWMEKLLAAQAAFDASRN